MVGLLTPRRVARIGTTFRRWINPDFSISETIFFISLDDRLCSVKLLANRQRDSSFLTSSGVTCSTRAAFSGSWGGLKSES